MIQSHFDIFDMMMRACILLGLIFMTFSHFILILKNRKANEEMKLLHFYKGFAVQKLPIYSTYICSILLALSIFRVGSILKVDSAHVPSLAMWGVTFISGEELKQNMNGVYIICIAAAVTGMGTVLFRKIFGKAASGCSESDSYTISLPCDYGTAYRSCNWSGIYGCSECDCKCL